MKKWIVTCSLLVCVACSTPRPTQQTDSLESNQETVEAVTPSGQEAAKRPLTSYLKREGLEDSIVIELEPDGIRVDNELVLALEEGVPNESALVIPDEFAQTSRSQVLAPLLDALEKTLEARQDPDVRVSVFTSDSVTYWSLVQTLLTLSLATRRAHAAGQTSMIDPNELFVMVQTVDGWSGFEFTSHRTFQGTDHPIDVVLMRNNHVNIAVNYQRIDSLSGCTVDGMVVCARPDGRLDRVALYNTLSKLKTRHPELSFARLTAPRSIKMSALIELVEVVRSKRSGGNEDGSFAGSDRFDAAAHSRSPVHTGPSLFPVIMLGVSLEQDPK